MSQLRAELTVAEARPRLYHLRQEQGRREIDLVAELGAERVIALEVKANSAPGRDSGRHLAWLRYEIGDRFVAGVVLHTSTRSYPLGERITDALVCAASRISVFKESARELRD